jgi:hypothetical protein
MQQAHGQPSLQDSSSESDLVQSANALMTVRRVRNAQLEENCAEEKCRLQFWTPVRSSPQPMTQDLKDFPLSTHTRRVSVQLVSPLDPHTSRLRSTRLLSLDPHTSRLRSKRLPSRPTHVASPFKASPLSTHTRRESDSSNVSFVRSSRHTHTHTRPARRPGTPHAGCTLPPFEERREALDCETEENRSCTANHALAASATWAILACSATLGLLRSTIISHTLPSTSRMDFLVGRVVASIGFGASSKRVAVASRAFWLQSDWRQSRGIEWW